MFNLDSFRIRTKSLVPIAMAALAIFAVSIFSGLQINTFTKRAAEIIDQRDKALVDLLQSARHINRALIIPLRSILYDADDRLLKDADQELSGSIKAVAANLQEAARLIPERGVELQALAGRFAELHDDLGAVRKHSATRPSVTIGRSLTPADLDTLAEATQIMHRVDLKSTLLVDALAAIVKQVGLDNSNRAAALQADAEWTMKLQVACGLLATLLSAGLSIWIVTRKIAAPLTRLATRMESVANGDLDVEIEGVGRRDEIGEMAAAVQVFRANAIERKRIEEVAREQREIADTERRNAAAQRAQAADERAAIARREAEQMTLISSEREAVAAEQARAMRHIGDAIRALASKNLVHRIDEPLHSDYEPLRAEFNAALDQLEQAFIEVASAANSVNHGALEITAATKDLAQRTDQQASNIEESAASLDEITTTVHKTAGGATTARDSVVAARADAARGAEVINLTTQAMARIEASARKVTEIIGVIDEIAFQTNLLALNAGVEAARAGDAGRGFAVVASEVRALAQRAAGAAKEIKELISASGQEVQHGVALVAQTGGALSKIAQTVVQIDEIVCAIANDAKTQAGGLTEINAAVRQIDRMTQQNAAMAEEATAATLSLSHESERLTSLVQQFTVAGRQGGELRQQLRRAAPHAFAEPPARPTADARPARPLRVASAGRRSDRAPAPDEDWKAF